MGVGGDEAEEASDVGRRRDIGGRVLDGPSGDVVEWEDVGVLLAVVQANDEAVGGDVLQDAFVENAMTDVGRRLVVAVEAYQVATTEVEGGVGIGN